MNSSQLHKLNTKEKVTICLGKPPYIFTWILPSPSRIPYDQSLTTEDMRIISDSALTLTLGINHLNIRMLRDISPNTLIAYAVYHIVYSAFHIIFHILHTIGQ